MKMFYYFNFNSYIVKILIETNGNRSKKKKKHFSDAYRNVNYIGSLVMFTGLIHFACDPI